MHMKVHLVKVFLPKKPFYIIRHGETTANVEGKTSGIKDIDLTPVGIRQAENAALVFKALNLDNVTIFSSPLKRAFNTAEIINQGKHKIIPLPQLKERDFGIWEGVDWRSILLKLEEGAHPPKGETTLQHIQRSLSAFKYILEESASKNTIPLIVSHGGSFYTFGRFYNQTKIENVGNCELYYFEPTVFSDEREENLIPWKTWKLKLTGSSSLSYEDFQLYGN